MHINTKLLPLSLVMVIIRKGIRKTLLLSAGKCFCFFMNVILLSSTNLETLNINFHFTTVKTILSDLTCAVCGIQHVLSPPPCLCGGDLRSSHS